MRKQDWGGVGLGFGFYFCRWMNTNEYLGLSQKSLLSNIKSLASFLKVISTQVFKTDITTQGRSLKTVPVNKFLILFVWAETGCELAGQYKLMRIGYVW